MLLAGLGLCMVGCGQENPEGESMGMTSTGDETSTGSGEPVVVDPRFFGTFRTLDVGYVSMTTPEGAIPMVFWSQIEFFSDHTLVYELHNCLYLLETTTLEWEYIPGENKISILPNKDGLIIIKPTGQYSKLTYTIDEECDGLNAEGVVASSGKENGAFFSRGRVCAIGDSCEYFEITWCDEGEPPPLCEGS
ncbi:MAG TPA: hypothetical protein ENK31_08115 [Nannocystis exedens]|nr:hypothetical protein [Nannocystis exedens]